MINNFDISDKVCVITGGSGVLGGTVAVHLLENNARVVILDNHQERLNQKMENIDESNLSDGGKLYNTFCSVCHQRNALGNDRFPPLNGTKWVLGDKTTLINVVLNGLRGKIMVKNKPYYNAMPKLNMLKDEEIAEILTYIRQNFGNNASAITANEVANVRSMNE